MRASDGFGLVELLIAAAIAIIILGLITQGIKGGASATALVQNRQKLLEDLRASGNFLADTLSNAAYIYPPGTQITLNTKSSYTVHNTNVSPHSNVWVVGRDPFVAGLLPPEIPGDACQPDKDEDDYTTSGCLYFVAFYAIQRHYIVKHAGGTANPGKDTQNKDDKVLYYYSKVTPDRQVPDPPPTIFGGASGSLVADYLAPDGMEVAIEQCAGHLTTVTGCPGDGLATPEPSANNSALRVKVSLQGRLVRQREVFVPSKPSKPLDFYFAPRNLRMP
jgi:Tfp pilus assembly protein PilE